MKTNQNFIRFVCTTVHNREETALFRSYVNDTAYTDPVVNNAMRNSSKDVSISLAVRATSAAPTYFPEVVWKGLVFWDGGLLNNNPIDQLWYARNDLVGPEEPEPRLSCVLSLGTGYTTPRDTTSRWLKLVSVVSSVVALATNTGAKAQDFKRYMTDLRNRPNYRSTKYFRFNPDLEDNNIGLADYTKVPFLIAVANKFIHNPARQRQLDDAAIAICGHSEVLSVKK
jgi:hypothetical protein